MQVLNYVQSVVNFGFFFCLGLYVYYMVVRIGKKRNVDLQMWLVVCAGLLLSMSGQIVGIVQGSYGWAQVRITIIASAILLTLAVWTIYRRKLWRKQEIEPRKTKGGGQAGSKSKTKSKPEPKAKQKQNQKQKPKR